MNEETGKQNNSDIDPAKNGSYSTSNKPKEEQNSEINKNTGWKHFIKKYASVLAVIRDISISAFIVIMILVSLYAYTGVWPPMVVIESNSMMHGDDSEIGIIDTGDLTLVKAIHDRHDVVTYLEATCATNPNHGFKTYGDFGNVIVYRKNGLPETPVIHRPLAYIDYNATASNPPLVYCGDILDIGIHNVTEYTITNVGYQKLTIKIDLNAIFKRSVASTSRAPHGGFITVGDHNQGSIDQLNLKTLNQSPVEPVKVDWVVGKAEGELPWFGIFKLWISGHAASTFPNSSVNGLVTTVILLIVIPIVIDLVLSRRKKRKESRRELRKRMRKNALK